jgi:hypothetical protein
MKGIIKMQELELNSTLDEINQLLSALGAQPYKEVFALVSKIQQQAQRQLEVRESASPASAD